MYISYIFSIERYVHCCVYILVLPLRSTVDLLASVLCKGLSSVLYFNFVIL